MPKDNFQSTSDSVTAPASRCFEITPNDSVELVEATKAIYVGTGGDVTLRSLDSAADVTFRNIQDGSIIDVRVSALRATGTSASDIVGLA
ncbi:MAG: hypothetical protein EP350_03410 [Alphaproteobacteria bacterium]|nr:MAG: hypothetical protein EP350_03410 [Alphaproteobacteria bacterium]